ncbi:MAG: DNA repair protein RecN [Desulfomonile tiedjei]|nr:DNA repair protein RecN [Desulfomonile tiedjei]
MLRYLKISNLAIIDKVEVEFREGFNVLTGETGAGKSILIGALELLLGSRSSPDLIRTGEEEAYVEGLFELPEGAAPPVALECLADCGNELVLSRRVFRAGRSRCSINGNTATLAMLQNLGEWLVSIFGQHEHHALLDPDEHVEILDRFGGLLEQRGRVSRGFAAWTKAKRDLSGAEDKLRELERLGQENAAAAEELAHAALKPNEEEELVQEKEVLKKAVQIRERAFEAYQTLYSRSGSLTGGLSEVRKAIEYLASANPRLSKMRDNFNEAVYKIEDVALELRGVVETSQSDPARLDRIEERLNLIRRLKKKYGKDIEGLISHLDALAEEAGDILDARSAARNMAAKESEARELFLAAANDLSEARRKTSRKLETAMNHELKELAMPTARFSASFQEIGGDKASAQGLEKVEFFLAPNPGEAPRPLARIASGGELSRIMLALKALQVDSRRISTVIFDEVDAGIGGHTAFAVGTRLDRVAQRQQVLCVTHLHQIAALAENHLSVRKSVRDGRTHITVTALNRDERVEELARMLGASPHSESVKEHVKKLMDHRIAEVAG